MPPEIKNPGTGETVIVNRDGSPIKVILTDFSRYAARVAEESKTNLTQKKPVLTFTPIPAGPDLANLD